MQSLNLKRHHVITLVAALFLLLSTQPARAALDSAAFTTELDSLILEGNDLLVQVNNTVLNSLTMDSQLAELETAVTNYQANIVATYDSVVAAAGTTLSLTSDMLVALQTLSTVSLSLANAFADLTVQIGELAASTSLAVLDSSLAAMLRLSDDIGLMADRILEMADKILIMADNIGLMADRIIATQIIQSDNLKLILDATLTTQNNTIKLISLFL
ncbi:hypothetical protein GF1_25980 [Desulfolithobacter dissulfuricans]|uniref:Uncharacterized protein n=1 Tax=Desulfolithobacter dissulfuricans TaxID=2795293 RepID=A0A915U6I2_9BACT|nr:hypothetical protein [Desulfolithobacter dissulfuricans]BCO10222.1 hypothetical protein GF1_25980 [Desulfolithobacter dissulfuricans]